MSADTSFGKWVKQRRKSLDLTQGELAQRVGCAASMLQKVESDERRPSRQMAESLAQALCLAPDKSPAFVEFARAGQRALAGTPFRSPSNLPAPVTPLIGRERDAAKVRQRLLQDDTRLVTLLGPPGIGKTRLSLQVATEVRDHFDDGVFFIELASIADPELVAPTIIQVLGLEESGRQSPLDHLSDYLRDKLMLLVLDNLEQVIGSAPMIARLLAACPQIKLLATSRVPLRIRAERQWPVPPLTLPDLAHLPPPELLADYSACALFVDRAQAIQPGFAITAANAETVARICYRLDGLPLAIELIAARIKIMSPSELLARLGGKLLMQSDGLRDVDERQRTLQNTVEWSYNLLAPEEQILFARLAVFVGGWSLEAAEHVCAGQVLDTLTALVNKSLVVQYEQAGESRFTMLEAIREYAWERLAARGEAEALCRRHAAYYLALAETAEPHLTRPEQTLWLKRLERDYDNLRAVLSRALECADVETAARLCGALRSFWVIHARLGEGRRWLERMLACTAESQIRLSPSVRVKLLNGAGSLAYYQGDHASTRSFFEEGLALARAVGDKWGMAFALDGLGAEAANQGDHVQAVAFSEQSLALSREIGDKWLSAITLINLGELARVRGDYQQTTRFFDESLALLREVGDKLFIAIVFHNLGQVAQDRGQYDRAKVIHKESLTLCRELGSQRGVAMCQEKLAGVAAAQGELERAARLLGAAEALRQAITAPIGALDRLDYDHVVAVAHVGLDEKSLAAAWSEGRAMTPEQAIAYALADS